MKKVNEINLNVGNGEASRGKQRYYSGYSGGMTDSAASAYSSLVGARKFDMPLEEEEDSESDIVYEEKSERDIDLMRETNFKRIKKPTGGYSLIETLKVLNENLDNKSLRILDEMEKIHKGLITDLIDSIQSIIEIIPANAPIPFLDQAKAGGEYVGGTILQFTGGNVISKLSKSFAATRANEGSITATISELSPILLALPSMFATPTVAIINKVIFDAIECMGNLGNILDNSPTKKDSMYDFSVIDVAKELLGDSLPSAIEAVDPTEIADGFVGSIRLVKNLIELWYGTGKGEELIAAYTSANTNTIIEPSQENDISALTTDNINNSDLEALIDKAIESNMAESMHYGIDEDLEEESEEEVDEHLVGGFSGPMKAPTKKQLAAQDIWEQKKALSVYAEEVRKLQIWKLQTAGRTTIR